MTMPLTRLLCGALLAAAVGGCANTPTAKGILWWPQGPGDAPADALRTVSIEPVQSTHDGTAHSASMHSASDFDNAVRYGDLLFVSAQTAEDPVSHVIVRANVQHQARAAMDNVARILQSHGLAVSNILSVTMYLQDIEDLPEADAVYRSYFPRSLPARSVVHVDGLEKGSLVAISVIAGK
jgi:2-iminobutanoate/2-iminopropanoate deaminase